MDAEVRLKHSPDVGLQGSVARQPCRQLGRVSAPGGMGVTGQRGEDGKGSACLAGEKPPEGIGRTLQTGSTPYAPR